MNVEYKGKVGHKDMKAREMSRGVSTKNIIRIVAITVFLLLIPFLAMLFNWHVPDPGSPELSKVNWSVFDFVVVGVLLLGAGFAYELFARRITTSQNRIVLAVVLLAILVLIWGELAVGIFGTPFAGS